MPTELPKIPGEWFAKILAVTPNSFEGLAVELFNFQYHNNKLYQQFTNALGIQPQQVKCLADIPFLPVSFFKTHGVTTTAFTPQAVFESSGTTKTINSKHLVKNVEGYKASFTKAFEMFYGPVEEWCIIGLLPSYLERNNSSLTMMVDELIQQSQHADSGFYLYDILQLQRVLERLEATGQKVLLIGVTFALLDFAEQFAMQLRHTVIMETGGMKGRRQEMTRGEVHDFLQQRLGVQQVHSEYGMTELLSQAYSKGKGVFYCPPWMKVVLRDEDDPLHITPNTHAFKTGVVNVIDLANIYSCCFIATDDVGKLYADGGFEVMGRLDNSDIRGCSLMVM